MKNEAVVSTIARKLFVYKHMTFGEWLRKKIQERDWSNARVARLAGVSVSTIVVVENEGSTYRWHVSAMPRSRTGKAIGLIGNISKDQMNSIMEYCIKLLKGVGDGELSTIPPGDGGFHLFKNLSDGELAMVRKWSVSQN